MTFHACRNFKRFLRFLMHDEVVLTCTDGVRVIFDDDGVLVEHLGVLLSVL